MKLLYSRKIFEKFSNVKFHKNPSMTADSFGADRQKDAPTDMTKLTLIFAILQLRI